MIRGYISKIVHILREEGPAILSQRIIRYIAYRIKRAFIYDHKDIDKWETIKNQYSGQRAFLIGNGPSLNKIPLYLLKDEFTIVFNRFDLMLERLGWTPSAYSTIDDVVLDDTLEVANQMASKVKYAFFPDIHPSGPISQNFKSKLDHRANIYWLHLGRIGFASDLPNCGINKTVANVAVQILAFMGFSEIYFIGVDLDYKSQESARSNDNRALESGENDDPNHFDPRYFGQGSKYHIPRMEETFKKFDEAARFLSKKGIKGMNAGVGGNLESFERIKFEELFSYDKKAQLRLMLSHVVPVNSADLHDLFPNALNIDDNSKWDDDYEEIIVNGDDAANMIPQNIERFVPYGPWNGKYVFLKRTKYEIPYK